MHSIGDDKGGGAGVWLRGPRSSVEVSQIKRRSREIGRAEPSIFRAVDLYAVNGNQSLAQKSDIVDSDVVAKPEIVSIGPTGGRVCA